MAISAAERGQRLNSHAIINACRPYSWIDRFPPVNALSPELCDRIRKKWQAELE